MKNFFKLIICLAGAEAAGVVGSIFTVRSVDSWYRELAKPALAPPAWVFGPVWTTLFALMGIAAFLVWKKGLERREVKIALSIFIGQLVLNAFWSMVFFGWRSLGGAFAEIIFLWLAILATMVAFAKVSRPAAWLLLPYLAWVSFAGYLNYSIWQLNQDQAKGWPDGEWKAVYIHPMDWPPKLQVVNEPFACTEAGAATTRAGLTERRVVNGRTYCVTRVSDGAAGSIYTQYAYAFPREGQTAILTFSLRAAQCANYDELQKIACESERESFDLDSVIDRLAKSLKEVKISGYNLAL